MRPGDMIQLTEKPWHQHAGDCVIVTKVDDDGLGFDFVIPEQRGHSPMKFAQHTLSHFDLDKLGVKPECHYDDWRVWAVIIVIDLLGMYFWLQSTVK